MSAISAALSGLKVTKESLNVTSANIANADNEHYAQQEAISKTKIIAGKNVGVEISEIRRYFDPVVDENIRIYSSSSNSYETTTKYLDQIQSFMGELGDPANPNQLVLDFFSSIAKLSSSVSEQSLKEGTAIAANNLATNLSNLAQKMHKVRHEIDVEFNANLESINYLLEELHKLNLSINASTSAYNDDINHYQLRDQKLEELSKYIDIKTMINKNGTVSVNMLDGVSLLDVNTYTQFEYQPTTSISDFISSVRLSPVNIKEYNSSKELIKSSLIVTDGFDSISEDIKANIKSNIKSGKLSGLLELRDQKVPNMIKMLDVLSEQIVENINKIHNKGSGYPPVTKLTGSRPVSHSDYTTWSGSSKIAIVDINGAPIKLDDGSQLKPLELNLSNLNSGKGLGKPDVRTIINEINEYFFQYPQVTRSAIVSANDQKEIFRDVKLVPSSDLEQIVGSNRMKFDLELDNNSQFDAEITITDIAVKDSTNTLMPNAATFSQNDTAKITAGSRSRTGKEFTLEFGPVLTEPYDVEVSYKAVAKDGSISIGKMSYSVKPSEDIRNIRHIANSLSGNMKSNHSEGASYARAKIVDEQGNEVVGYQQGFISIETSRGDYRIIIDDYDSSDLGVSLANNQNYIQPTKRGFGHYFGMNDLFVQSYDGKNSAYNMKINPDIAKDSSRISVGQMLQNAPLHDKIISVGDSFAKSEMKFQNNTNLSANDSINVFGSNYIFTNSATPGKYEVTIGADLATTINNLATKLNNEFSNVASFVPIITATEFSLAINALNKGSSSNGLTISANLSVQADLGSGMSLNPNGSLQGGIDKETRIKVKTYGYGISSGSNQIANLLTELQQQNITFLGGQGLSGGSMTLTRYASNFMSHVSSKLNEAKSNFKNHSNILQGFIEQRKSYSEVDKDTEIAKLMNLQHAFSANSKVLKIMMELEDTLINLF